MTSSRSTICPVTTFSITVRPVTVRPVTVRPVTLAAALLASSLLAACHHLPQSPIPVYATAAHSETLSMGFDDLPPPSRARSCLLVMLPGIGDRAPEFAKQGFVDQVRRQSTACDVVMVDAHFTYYLTQSVVPRVTHDVLHEAHRRGYRSVWMVGISLGGYGAVLTARANPGLVDGVVLIAPMLGVPPKEEHVADEIIQAGGLKKWSGLADDHDPPPHHFREPRLVWDWLRQAAIHSDRLVLAYGTEDKFSARHALLAEALPETHVFRTAGSHDWDTWKRLWTRVVAAQPWTL